MSPEAQTAYGAAAAWRAEVKGGLVALWQVYIDIKIVFDVLAKTPLAPSLHS